MKKYYFIIIGTLSFILGIESLYAVEAVITSFNGNVGIQAEQADEIQPAFVGKLLSRGDVLITGKNSSAELTLSTGHIIFVEEKTALRIETLEEANSRFNLPKGKLRAKVSKLFSGQEFEIKTPVATCSIRGTEFEVAVSERGKTLLKVFTGMVEAKEIITGKSVLVKAGQFSSIISGRAPTKPRKIKDKDKESRTAAPAKEDRFAEAKKEIFEEISKQEVLSQARADIKNAEYQNGKVLIDAYGKRVRLEEYIMRPAADQFKYVVLNKRDNRFDFGKILFTFNKTLPEDLTIATKDMFRKEGVAPAWYPTDVLSIMSNTIDTVTEDASGGHPEAIGSGSSLYYQTMFDKYNFYANDTRLWGYDKTTVPQETYYHGGTAPTSYWLQPDGALIFHFIAKDVYSDGTWIVAEDYIINDEGDVASLTDIVDLSNVSADDIRSKIIQMNFERVYYSSLFEGRTIDVVYSAKLLSDAGILNLPTSLGAPTLSRGTGSVVYKGSQKSGGSYQMAKLRETGSDPFPQPERPYEKDTVPDTGEKADALISHVAALDVLGGQYFVEGNKTKLKGNFDLLYVPVINLSENTALLPIYMGKYQGTKDVKELVGGGTLVQTSMNHSLYAKVVHKMDSGWTYKGIWGLSGEWLAETKDETLSKGLFNSYRYTSGLEVEKLFNTGKWKAGYDYGITDYYNYQSLSSDDKFADVGIINDMGKEVLDYQSHDVSFGVSMPFGKRMVIETNYRLSYLLFKDQKIVGKSGEYSGTKRNDMGHTISVNSVTDLKTARLGLGYGIQYYDSNQNAYDADRTYYTENYYDYLEQKITPSISFFLGSDKSILSLYWDITFTKYLDRKVQDTDGDFGTSKIGQVANSLGLWLKYPVFKQVSFKMKLNYLMSSSNMKYESTYIYNYDVVNYFIGFGWEL